LELDAAAIMESINKGINPDVIGAISSKRKFALVYKGEIVAQGSILKKINNYDYRRKIEPYWF